MSNQFIDRYGRTWTVEADAGAIARAQEAQDVDLNDLVRPELPARLQADPALLVDVIYSVCRPEADAAGISAEDFGRRLIGQAISDATTALLTNFVGRFERRHRPALRRAINTIA